MIKVINITFADIIKVWEINRAKPITETFLDGLISNGIGKKENNYYIFTLDKTPTVGMFNSNAESTAFNMCKMALENYNKRKRGNRYTHFMFTK